MRNIIFTVFILVYSGASYGSLKCTDLLKANKLSFEQRANQLFSNSDAEQMISVLSEVFSNKLAGMKKSVDYNIFFEVYLEERLKLLPENIRTEIGAWLTVDNLNIKQKANTLSGRLSEATEKITVVLPPELAESFVSVYILVHEVEHLIQARTIGFGSITWMHPHHFPVHRFNLEKGAMRAEAVFLMSLPDHVLSSELLKVESFINMTDNKVGSFLKDAFESALSSRNTDEYLEKTWATGRYSHKKLLKAQIVNLAIAPGSFPFIIAFFQYMGW